VLSLFACRRRATALPQALSAKSADDEKFNGADAGCSGPQ
jgi:hypothetical protein